MKSKPFRVRAVSRFVNGKPYRHFLVAGTIGRKRVQKAFSNRAEALGECARQEILRKNSSQGLRVISHLSEHQARDAEAALTVLGSGTASLTDAARFYKDNFRGLGHAPNFTDAIKDYLAQRTRDQERGAITRRQLGGIRSELRRLEGAFAGQSVAAVSHHALKGYLEADRPAPKTWNNRRGLLSTFFKYCAGRDWLLISPVEKIAANRLSRARGVAETLTAGQVGDLMRFLETFHDGRMVNNFSLSLFAGLRPDCRDGEIYRFRAKFIDWKMNTITLPPEVTKTNEMRTISLAPNLRAWLTHYPLEKFLPVPVGCGDLRVELSKKFNLGHDVLRHTFISMLVARDRSIGDAALAAGNSEAIIRKHYLRLKTREEADQFWSIIPSNAAEKIVKFNA